MTAVAATPKSSVSGWPTTGGFRRRGRGRQHDRRLEVDLVLGLGEAGKLEAAF